MNCEKCGTNNAETSAFCVNCGSPLSKGGEANPNPQAGAVNNSYSSAPGDSANTAPPGNSGFSGSNYPNSYSAPNYPTPNYPTPNYPDNNYYPYQNHEKPVSVGEWVVTMIVFSIPLVNLIMLLVWSFSSKTNKSKSNFCKATLILSLAVLVIYLVIFFIWGTAAFSSFSRENFSQSSNYYY